MSKEIEALIRIEDLLSRLDETDVINDDHLHDTNIIYEALKRLEELEKAFDTLSKENEKVMKELSKEIEKNRALETIKKYELLSVYHDNDGKCFVVFTGKYGFEFDTAVEIPQEEFDLLIKVL